MIEDLDDIISEIAQIQDFITAAYKVPHYIKPCSLLIATAGTMLSALLMDIYKLRDNERKGEVEND